VALTATSATPPNVSVTPTTLTFGNVPVGTISAIHTMTLNNTGGSTFTSLTVTFPAGSRYSRAGGTCDTGLLAGSSCTIDVVFSPAATGASNSNVAITSASTSFTVTGSPVTLNGTGSAPTRPSTLSVLDTFDRPNANTLGSNWLQATGTSNLACILLGGGSPPCAIIRGSANQATTAGLLAGYAVWRPTVDFTGGQAAAFTFVNNAGAPTSPVNGSSIVLKGSGPTQSLGSVDLQVPQNLIRVRYVRTAGTAADQVVVEYSTNNGGGYTSAGTITLPALTKFATNETLTAWASATGVVSVFRTTAANVTTYLGSALLPNDPLWTTGGGAIGVQLPASLLAPTRPRVDNFAGGTVP
jgi:hypothetical protein